MSDEPRFLNVPVRVWDGLSGLVAVVGFFAAVAGIYLAVAEYREAQTTRAVDRVMKHAESWDNDGIATAWSCLETHVARALGDLAPDVARAKERARLGASDAFDALYGKVTASVFAQASACDRAGPALSTEQAFSLVVDHFRRLSLCVEAQICHLPTAQTYYEDTIDDLMVIFATKVDALAANRPRQAQSIRNLHAMLAGG